MRYTLIFKLVLLYGTLMSLFHPAVLSASSHEVFTIDDYSRAHDFKSLNIVKFSNDDNSLYADPKFDDTHFITTSFPILKKFQSIASSDVCWYRIHIRFPKGLPSQSVGISLGTISDTDIVYFNGQEIGRTGREGPTHIPAYDQKRIYEIPSRLIRPDSVNVIALRVHSYFKNSNGLHSGPFVIAPLRQLHRDFMMSEMKELFFIMIYLIVVLYFAFIFIRKTIDREYLFFALFAAFSAVYLFLRTQSKYFITDDFFILKQIEYILLFCIPVFMLEYMTYYYERRHTILHYAAVGLSILLIAGTFVFYEIRIWNNMLLYFAEPLWILILGYCLYLTLRFIRQSNDAKYQFISYLIIMIFFVNDVLYDRGIINTMRLSTYGFLVVIISTSVIMRNRFRQIYETAECANNKRRGFSLITGDNRKKLDDAIAYISQNYKYDISRENLAASIGMHEDYFGKLFRKYTGSKVGDYINELRINEACRLFETVESKIIDVAFSVGFESLSTFYRVFQSVKKVSPGEWLEKTGKKNKGES